MRKTMLWGAAWSAMAAVSCGGGVSGDLSRGDRDATETPGDSDATATSDDDGITDDDGDATGTVVVVLAPRPHDYVDTLPLNVGVTGTGVTHYRYKLDTDADYGDVIAVATPIALDDVPTGRRTLSVIGKGANGLWQSTATTAEFSMITLVHTNRECGQCDVLVPATTAEKWYVGPDATAVQGWETPLPGDPAVLAPGSVICLAAGDHGPRTFRSMQGSSSAPLVITNCGGQAVVTRSAGAGAALQIEGVTNLSIVGTGSTVDHYGITLRGASNGSHGVQFFGGSSDFEIAFVEVDGARNHAIDAKSDSSAGEMCTWNRDTFVQRNTFIHDVYLHDVFYLDPDNAVVGYRVQGYEAIYAGSSHWASSFTATCNSQSVTVREHELNGVRVHDSIIEHIGNEGIQIGAAPHGVAVYRNVVRDVGKHKDSQHSNGIQFGGGTTGLIAANVIDGAGIGIYVAGPGNTQVINNVIANTGGTAIQNSDTEVQEGTGWWFINNTMVNIGVNACLWGASNLCYCGSARGLCFYDTHSTGSVYYNNLAPGTAAVPSSARLSIGNNIVDGSNGDYFVDAGQGDYHLKAGAGAIGAGRDVSAYGVASDIEGSVRNSDSHDVGAYAYGP